MATTVLITGGAGFIGRAVTRLLLARGHHVRILDCFNSQVHGAGRPTGPVLADAEIIHGDVRDADAIGAAVRGVDSVIHLAAEVGVGQSMYEVVRYVGVNDLGTATLFEALIRTPVRRVIVASSMSIYGEGLYRDADGRLVEDVERGTREPGAQSWDPLDSLGRPLHPVPTPEWKRPSLASVYALTKYTQERLTLVLAGAYGMEGVALRLWNTYGAGQPLSNPYTGVLANLATRLLAGRAPLIFEDGEQKRDFVHVDDVASAFVLALTHPRAAGRVFNVASGRATTVKDAAVKLAAAMGKPHIEPEITGGMRSGDIRHCIPDISLIREELGFEPQRTLTDGLEELAGWVSRQQAEDRIAEARAELSERGLVL